MRIFITGGCKNGKSTYAQRLAKAQGSGAFYYLATMCPGDTEDEARVKRHRVEREGLGFLTVEQPVSILNCLSVCNRNGSFLLDSVTALLANEMFLLNGGVDEDAPMRVAEDIRKLTAITKNIVIVSDYIYSDAIRYDALTEKYRQGLALCDRAAVDACDVFVEAAFATMNIHKGRGLLHT